MTERGLGVSGQVSCSSSNSGGNTEAAESVMMIGCLKNCNTFMFELLVTSSLFGGLCRSWGYSTAV